jgi:hypothetical protein
MLRGEEECRKIVGIERKIGRAEIRLGGLEVNEMKKSLLYWSID